MQFRLNFVDDYDFAYSYLPRVLPGIAQMLLDSRANLYENYLQKEWGVDATVPEILNVIFNSLDVTTDKLDLIIRISNTKMFDGKKVIIYAQFLEFGNTELKGLNLITKTFNYAKAHLGSLQSAYKLGMN